MAPELIIENEVMVWQLQIDDVLEVQLANLSALLSKEELLRKDRFVFKKEQKRYIFTRAFTRILLAPYLEIKPRDIRFECNDYGRPLVCTIQNKSNLDFNISHTNGLIVWALVKNGQIGVDVENTRKPRSMSVAADFFSPLEVDALFQQPLEAQRQRFYDLWTLKEAYIKAVGMGLSLPLHSFGFSIDNQYIQFTDYREVEQPEHWTFQLLNYADKYKIAIAFKP